MVFSNLGHSVIHSSSQLQKKTICALLFSLRINLKINVKKLGKKKKKSSNRNVTNVA